MKLKRLTQGDTFRHKGKTITIGETKRWEESPMLDSKVYEPIEAYSERWKAHSSDKIWFCWWSGQGYPMYNGASPIPGTRKRNDLPPLFLQWKDDAKKRRKS